MNKVKKIIKRSFEELYATYNIAKKTSVKEALNTLHAKVLIQKSVRQGLVDDPKVIDVLNKKHITMLSYFQKDFEAYFKNYKVNQKSENYNRYPECIWMCWWQGIDNAPVIVKKCIESIQVNSGDHKVILITENNYQEYVSFPNWVIEKVEKGIISRTHFADILRLTLLAEYGGIWLDATFFCCSDEVRRLFDLPLWSIKRPNYSNLSVANGYFANYSLGCNNQYRWVFQTIKDYFLHYWEKYDYLIDYLTLDYMIVLAQKNNPEIEAAFYEIPTNNPRCDDLLYLMSEPFNKNEWKSLISETYLFKLSWKANFKENINGLPTYYYALLNDWLTND